MDAAGSVYSVAGSGQCNFCSTLVDRIVTGYPRDGKLSSKLTWAIMMLSSTRQNTSILFVIQGPKVIGAELQSESYPLNVLIEWHQAFKERKVAILNGTPATVLLQQAGFVRERGDEWRKVPSLKKLFMKIIPVLDLPRPGTTSFARW